MPTTTACLGLVLLLFASASAQYDCDYKPCPDEVAPVCGGDGFSYQHECLAICQGVKVASKGLCAGDTTKFKGLPRNGLTGQLTTKAAKTFSGEGFFLIGTVAMQAKGNIAALQVTTKDESLRVAKLVDAAPHQARAALRLTSNGLLYIATERSQATRVLSSVDEAAKKLNISQPSGKGSTGKNGSEVVTATVGRKLRYIFGADDRTQTSSIATTYPWRTIGQVNMQGSDGNRYTCSGATVGPRAIVTAGHCVHSGPGGSGWYNVQFSAGRSCSTCNPYGTLQWSWITTYRAWTNSRDWRYDVAVVQFPSNIGNTVGWMGLTWNLQTGYLNTAGYPGDKPSGTQWFTSRQETDLWPYDKLFYTQVDIIPGQSGSPAWELRSDGTRYIKGVVSHQACNRLTADNRTCIGSGYNGIVQFDSQHFSNILAWR